MAPCGGTAARLPSLPLPNSCSQHFHRPRPQRARAQARPESGPPRPDCATRGLPREDSQPRKSCWRAGEDYRMQGNFPQTTTISSCSHSAIPSRAAERSGPRGAASASSNCAQATKASASRPAPRRWPPSSMHSRWDHSPRRPFIPRCLLIPPPSFPLPPLLFVLTGGRGQQESHSAAHLRP